MKALNHYPPSKPKLTMKFKPTLRGIILASVTLLMCQSSLLAQTIAPAMAAPAGAVNTAAPGFKMRIIQGNARSPQSTAAIAEALLSGKQMDPATGAPFENTATPNPADGSFVYAIETYINMHEQQPNNPDIAGGNFTPVATAPHNIPENPIPGIPGTSGNGDYFAVEFTGYMQLPAGTVRLGVNSDDGFRLTFGNGINPRDPGALQVAINDGNRGFGNTEVNLTVTQAGIYPFRLVWWENTGANSGIEFFNFQPGQTSGNRYLINDPGQPNSVKVYRELLTTPPLVTRAGPFGGQVGVAPAPYMQVEITDGSTTLDAGSVLFSLDGKDLAHTASKSGAVTTIAALAPLMTANTLHTNRIVFKDSAGTSTTNVWTFTVFNYPALQASMAVPSVDTSKPGFKVKMHQIDISKNPATGIAANAERQIADGYIDSATGKPYLNGADNTNAGPDGKHVVPGVVNWNATVGGASGTFPDDEAVPGMPGTGAVSGDRYVASIETFLQLKAGPIRFAVASDDGFRLSFGWGPGDVAGVQFGTAGDRGFPNESVMDVVVPADGFYPVRLMFWDSGGGDGCEFYTVDLVTGKRTLVNDASSPASIRAFRESSNARPYVSRILPTANYGYAFADEDVIIDFADGSGPVVGDVTLRINGAVQTSSTSRSGNVTSVKRTGGLGNLLPSGPNNVQVIYGYASGGATVLVTNSWAFTVPAYTRPIPAGNRVSVGQVSGTGFKVRASQIDRSKDNNQGNGGRYTGNGGGGNNMPRPEIQLSEGYLDEKGVPYPNLVLTGPTPPPAGGVFEIPDVFNFNNAQSAGAPAANAGIFNADTPTPGLPGAGTSNFGLDNTVHEFTSYLELKAGAHVFGVNVDDGWVVSSAPNAKDTLGTLLGFRNAPGGQNGNPINNPNGAFNVIVPEDGIYPIRILFWQGGGGVNLEFLHLDRNTGTQILVNDVNGAFPSVVAAGGQLNSSVKAYSTYTGPTKPWVKFSVYPLPYIATTQPLGSAGAAVTLWQNVHQQSGPGPIQVKVPRLNGSWNSAEIANDSINTRPFGDGVGAVIADLGNEPVGLILDGVSVTPTVTPIPNTSDSHVFYTPPTPLSSASNHVAGLIYSGTTNWWIFSVINYTNVPTSALVSADRTDPNARGFRAKVVQALTATALANTVARAEAQLAGTPASVALPGTGPDGSYIVPGMINWNVQKNPGATTGEIGNFQPILTGEADEAVPGVPGTGLAGNARFESIAAEIFGYLDLPAGYQKFGVNGDDGWKVQIGMPGQTTGPVLFSVDRGAGARDFPFAFVTPAAGLYPVRLVWYQGTGGGNLEFFTYGPNNRKIAVNDLDDPLAIKAYHQLKEDQRPTLTSKRNGATLELTFTGVLQSADLANGPYTDVVGAASPATIPASNQQRFFRTRQ